MYPKAKETETTFRTRHDIIRDCENNPDAVVVHHGQYARIKHARQRTGCIELHDDCRDLPKEARRNIMWWLKLLKIMFVGLVVFGGVLNLLGIHLAG